MNSSKSYYQVGGRVDAKAPSYTERQADIEICQALREGDYCYVLESRQMGKTSLESRARDRLTQEGFTCISLDITSLSTDSEPERWYYSLAKQLIGKIDPSFKLSDWWWEDREYSKLPPLDRFGTFIETVLLQYVSENGKLIIFIDEIDSVLNLKKVEIDDFFLLVRSFYNKRNESIYKQLVFVLIGVAAPSDLIADKTRTPFNVGRIIELQPFKLSETKPLQDGLTSFVDNPEIVIREILKWTGGQPFLTQKLCFLIREKKTNFIAAQHEVSEIEKLVRSTIIHDWEGQDNPVHFSTIRDRILYSRQSSRLLGLYSQLLRDGEIKIDKNSIEQEELRLTGLLARQNGVYKTFSPIHREIFNEQWIHDMFDQICPYEEAISAWIRSGYTDISRLLRGNALQEAVTWVGELQEHLRRSQHDTVRQAELRNTRLDVEDKRFLESSQTLELIENLAEINPEVGGILKRFLPQLLPITVHPLVVIQEILDWVGTQSKLTELLCQVLIDVNSGSSIPENLEDKYIENLAYTHLVQDWQNKPAKAHLQSIQNAILEHEQRTELLQLYQQLLQQRQEIVIDNGDRVKNADPQSEQKVDQALLETLLNIGLIEKKEGRKRVANRLYAEVFNPTWIAQELAKQPPILQGRYEVLRKEEKENYILYFAKEQYRDKQYVIKQLIPISNDRDTLEATKQLLSRKLRGFGQVKSALFPDLDSYFEEDKFYVVQEYIDGHNLDAKDEISSDKRWRESKVIDLLIEILESLQPIHEKGLAHLNLKPSNLRRRSQDEKVVLIDFGFLNEITALAIALTQPEHFQKIATPGYTPPEGTGRWSDANYDIYAVGMIGIQALTGIEPQDLPTDPKTGEIVWRFATPKKAMVKVSDGLAQVLTKMVRHDSAERYTKTSEVYKDLTKIRTKRLFKALLERKGLLVAATTGLVLSSAFWGWHQHSLETLLVSNQNVDKEERFSQLSEQCNQSIQPEQNGGGNLLNVALIVNAWNIADGCDQLATHQQSLDNAQVLNKGKALLLLWKSSSVLNQTKDKQASLDRAKEIFETGNKNYKDDPEILFYLGLTRQLRGEQGYLDNYKNASEIYLNPDRQVQEEDYFILTKLASIISEFNSQDAIKLYEVAANKAPASVSSNHQANLAYNLGVLHVKKGDRLRAQEFFIDAFRKAQHKDAKDYLDNCLSGNDARNPTLCSGLLNKTLPVYSCTDNLVLTLTAIDERRICN
jgi:serine/threonine protein kinase